MADFDPRKIKIVLLKESFEFGYGTSIFELVNKSSKELNNITINLHERPGSSSGICHSESITHYSVKPGERREFRFTKPSLRGYRVSSFSGVLNDGRPFRRDLSGKDKNIIIGRLLFIGGLIGVIFSIFLMCRNFIGGSILMFICFILSTVGAGLSREW